MDDLVEALSRIVARAQALLRRQSKLSASRSVVDTRAEGQVLKKQKPKQAEAFCATEFAWYGAGLTLPAASCLKLVNFTPTGQSCHA